MDISEHIRSSLSAHWVTLGPGNPECHSERGRRRLPGITQQPRFCPGSLSRVLRSFTWDQRPEGRGGGRGMGRGRAPSQQALGFYTELLAAPQSPQGAHLKLQLLRFPFTVHCSFHLQLLLACRHPHLPGLLLPLCSSA